MTRQERDQKKNRSKLMDLKQKEVLSERTEDKRTISGRIKYPPKQVTKKCKKEKINKQTPKVSSLST